MNGFISKDRASGHQNQVYRFGSIASISFSLFAGFLAGFNLDFKGFVGARAFQSQVINYQSISWLKSDMPHEIAFQNIQGNPSLLSLSAPKPIQLVKMRQPSRIRTGTKLASSNLKKLRQAVEQLETQNRDPFTDFQIAANLHKGSFKNYDPKVAAEDSDWVLGNDLSIQVPVPRPHREPQPEFRDTELTSVVLSPDLSGPERKKIQNLLLSEQVKTTQAGADWVTDAKSRLAAQTQIKPPIPITLAQNEKRSQEFSKSMAAELAQLAQTESPKAGYCGLGVDHLFERPVNDRSPDMDIRICPEHLTWISKSWDSRGWIKLEGQHHLATLTLHPSPTEKGTLLMDEQQLGALAVRTGVRMAKGMGTITGLVPEGYKVEFAGRSEETEYFDSNSRKYFAILNAEPGAGVIELVSEKGQNQNSTVFVPVLEDVVTYLDLSVPEVQDFSVRVVKNGTANDPEVVGLTVGLSTQNAIQAITRSDGIATLSEVRQVKGFPTFVDISSRQKQENGYVYRYELKDKDSQGCYRVNQIAEKSLYRWLNQVKQGLSDQGAVVVGSYNRRRIDGFKADYSAKVQPLTAKFGLEPLNYTVLWNGEISQEDPLEGDLPRFMAVQVSEGLSQVHLKGPESQILKTDLIPVSPRVIHVVSP